MYKFNDRYAIIDSKESMKSFIKYMSTAHVGELGARVKVNVDQLDIENENNYPIILELNDITPHDDGGMPSHAIYPRQDNRFWWPSPKQGHTFIDKRNSKGITMIEVDHSNDKKALRDCERYAKDTFVNGWIYEY